MKQAKTTPDSKEGLHTQGEWYVSSVLHEDKYMCPVPYHEISVRDGDKSIWWLATVNASENAFSLEESKANAELIVQAVNERQALLDALKKAMNIIDRMDDEFRTATNRHSSYTRGEYNSLQDVVNRNS